jgi:hypothetical protein
VTWVKCNLVSVRMEITLISVLDRCTVCAECITGMEIELVTLTVHLVNIGQVDAHFSHFRDGVNLDVIMVHDLRWMYHRHGNHFGDSVNLNAR